MKKYILFDNDGVLVETEKWYFTANVEILKSMGIDLDEARYRDIMINGQSAFLLAEEAGYDPATVEAVTDPPQRPGQNHGGDDGTGHERGDLRQVQAHQSGIDRPQGVEATDQHPADNRAGNAGERLPRQGKERQPADLFDHRRLHSRQGQRHQR